MKAGGAVLCGGKSSRMGRAKAWLPFGDELMLQRVVRILSAVVEPVAVVAAPGQDVPSLPADVRVIRDEVEGHGPLGGLAVGLAALSGECDAVYLSACDAPFLTPGFVQRVVESLEEPLPPTPSPKKGGGASTSDARAATGPSSAESPSLLRGGVGEGLPSAVAPRVSGFLHPLAAAYRVGVLPAVRAMLAANHLRATDLFARVPARLLGPEEFAGVDPELRSLRNLNTPDEYAAALRELGAS